MRLRDQSMMRRSARRQRGVQFPDLRGQGAIAIDTETCDPELAVRGSGAWRRGTHIAGISVGTERGFRAYYPIGHEAGENLPRDKVLDWLRVQLELPVPKIGAHLAYDLGFLQAAGVDANGPFYDVQNAEPLLDDNRFSYQLGAIAKDRLGEDKVEDEILAYIKEKLGARTNKEAKGLIWRAPGEVVEPYAIGDVDLPLRLFKVQEKLLRADPRLWDLFQLESRLIPMLVAMHRRGVRVDLKKAEQIRGEYQKEQKQVLAKIKRMTGFSIAPWNAGDIAKVFDHLGLEYPTTPKTEQPSFKKEFLEHHEHPVAGLIRRARWLDKMVGTFLTTCVLEGAVNGRVHCKFNQQKSDEGGAVSGRFSSSLPNLQFIPIRGEGKLLRTLFLPDAGQRWWKRDYSQIEYRLIAHDAFCLQLPGSDTVVDQYVNDPDTDFHKVVAVMVFGTDEDEARKKAKTINFGLAYGEGPKKLARDLGLSERDGARVVNEYHRRAPFMRPLSRGFTNMAAVRGVIETLMGRKQRFVWFVKPDWDNRENDVYLKYKAPGFVRAFTHKALNARIQGSAADILKKAMVDTWEAGVYDALGGAPQLTVHDELDGSAPRTRAADEAMAELTSIMENVVKLSVPLRAEGGTGVNWGSVE